MPRAFQLRNLKLKRIETEAMKRELNLRDLGTIEGVPKGIYLRSGKLSMLGRKTCARLCRQYDIKCVIDLRSDVEAAEYPDPLPDGVEYLRIPLLKDATIGISRETGSDPMRIVRNLRKHPEQLREMVPDFKMLYRHAVTDDYSLGQLRHAVATLRANAEAGRCTLFHCNAGKDRTGLVTMALLKSYGIADDIILDDFMRSNRNILWPTLKKCIAVFLLTQRWELVHAAYHLLMADRELMIIALENYRQEG